MSVTTTAGTSLKISLSAPATLDLAGYTTLYASMKTIGEVTDLGDYDRVYNLVTSNPLSRRRTSKFKGTYDEGSTTIVYDIDPDDAGQQDLRTNSKLDDDAYFAITHQDGTVDFFSALVMGNPKTVGSADSVYMSSVGLEINSDIIESPAIP